MGKLIDEQTKLRTEFDSVNGAVGNWKQQATAYSVWLEKKLIERRACDVRSEWTKIRPDFPCVFVERTKLREDWEYTVWILAMVDGEDAEGNKTQYLGILSGDGEEWGDLEDFCGEEYLIIERGKIV